MELFRLLAEVSGRLLLLATVASAVSGLASLGTIIYLVRSIGTGPGGRPSYLLFAGFAVLAVACRLASRQLLARLSGRAVRMLRARLLRQVIASPLPRLEEIGVARLTGAFTTDIATVARTLPNFVALFSNVAFIAACLVYLGWLSPPRLAVTIVLLTACWLTDAQLRRRGRLYGQRAREKWDKVLQLFQMVVDGVKQVKLSATLRSAVLSSFRDRFDEHQAENRSRSEFFDAAATIVQATFFLAVGLAVFAPFPGAADNHLLAGFAIAMIYMAAPLQALVGIADTFSDATTALQRVADLGMTLRRHASPGTASTAAPSAGELAAAFRRALSFADVTYGYKDAAANGDFEIGPLTLSLHPGEIVFVTGGNGSGKTTFLKLLTGLYLPSSGMIRVDGETVGPATLQAFRNRFSAIFADVCLFDGVAGATPGLDASAGSELARRLKISAAMLSGQRDGRASGALSTGERRRVALLAALLEGRSIIVLDEWAADQDPAYKQFFYEDILPWLRESNKLVVVISHDDRYFHVADRVLRFERGAVPSWQCIAAPASRAVPRSGQPSPAS